MNDTVRYWRNIGGGRFDLPRSMPEAPAGLRLADSGVQLIDANGDGRTDLLVTTAELPGYYSLTFQGGWDRKKSFQRYRQAPSFNLEDPEVRLVDLDGDGVTDAIRAGTRLECYFNDPHQGWQPGGDHVRFKERRSDGFPANFSDPRVKWADMTGDGMQDVVLIHNRRIDYWPNLGYGEFGPRVTMHTAPELPLDYDPRRLLVGDVDGDGLADIIYIENRQLTLWINQGGNSWSERKVIYGTPSVTDMDSVRLVDLLGTGVSGVLWTQEARGDARDRYFFFDFTGGVKPYLLTEMNNHIGAITRVEYAPSTREYLRDQAEKSTQWRTPLPFPVQVVSRVEVIDEISKGKLTTEYRYHHGYWDGAEREFRGFGMVEQLDTEVIEEYNKSGLHGETAIFEKVETHFSPPTLTKTWFHQGPVGEEFGLWKEQDYTAEYWRGDQQILKHTEAVNTFLHTLPQRRIKRDALRTLRGSILRSELYALDGSPREDRPYIVTEYAYGLREEEIPADNNSSRERIFFPYGTAQRTTQWERGDDPLTQFSFTGKYDAYGQPLSQSALAMPRRSVKRLPRRSADVADEAGVLVTHTRTVYAEPGTGVDRYIHNRVARSTSFTFTNKPQVNGTQPSIALAELAKSLHDLFEVYLQNWQPIQGATSNYQILAHAVSYYDGAAYVGEDLGKTGLYGAPTRSESLIFTDDILNKAYNDTGAQRRPAYLGGTATLPPGAPANFGADHGYLDKRNSIAGYVPGYYVSAQQQKFDFQDGVAKPRGLPVAMRDPLNHASTIDQYDDFQFLPLKVTNPKGMSISAEYNLRVLQPRKVTDPNGNASEVAFSPSGLVTSSWIKGKNGEGDQTEPSSKLSYDFLAFRNTGKPIYVRAIKRCHHDTETDISLPDRNKTIESHEYSDGFGRVIQTRTQGEDVRFGDTRLGGGESVLLADQNDGRGNSVVGIVNNDVDHPNVVVSGWQVYDNKGKVVEKYEPFFSKGWVFEPETDSRHGVHAEMYYDPRGQVIRTVNPDGSEQRVIYGVPVRLDDPPLSPRDAIKFTPTPWEAYIYDTNDNAGRTHPNDAAALGYQHHWNTPASIAIDALGRTVRAVARHRESNTTHIEEHLTESSYDMQGNLLAISDALGRHAFSYIYDLAKHALRTGSIDAGTKHVVLNAVGNPIEGHDEKGSIVLHTYDVLNRPTHLWARDKMNGTITLREKLIYGDDAGITAPADHNLLGKLYQHYDEAGVVTVANYDFKGNVLESGRRVISDDFMLANVRAQTGPDWALSAPRVDWATQTNILEATEYRTRSAYDALNRIKWSDYPDSANGERYRLRPEYNRAGVLERVDLEGPLGTDDTGPRLTYVQRLAYNAKGQRTFIAYGNGKITRYAYDPKTFRLVRMRTEGYSQPNSLTYQQGSGVLQDLAYQYDLGGNILRIIDRTLGSGIRNNPRALDYPELQTLLAAGDALVRDFAYDPLYRLVSATGRESKNIPTNSRPWSDDAREGYNSGQHGTPDQDNAPNLTTLYREEYSYDAGGNMLTLRHNQSVQHNGGVCWQVQWSRRFGMDGRNPEQWRREATDHLTGEWINPPSNRLTHVEDRASGVATPPSVPQTHWYDANGNMVRENTERHFEWDQADRMKVFRVQTGTSQPSIYALYLYDSAGMRVKKLVWKSGGYTTTTYLGAAFEHHKEVKPGVTQENNHLHVMDDKSRIAIKRVGPVFDGDGAAEHPVQYHLGDHLGSSAVVVSGDGTWINREEFFPYGESSFGSFGRKRYRFTGKERDEESGLNYHVTRYYSPHAMKWVSCDPLGAKEGVNLFLYAKSSPVMFLDRTGMADERADNMNSDKKPDSMPKGRTYSQSKEAEKKSQIDSDLEYFGIEVNERSGKYWEAYIHSASRGSVKPSRKTSDLQIFVIKGGKEGFLQPKYKDQDADDATYERLSTPIQIYKNQDVNDALVALRYNKSNNSFEVISVMQLIIPNSAETSSGEKFTRSHEILYSWDKKTMETQGYEFPVTDKKTKKIVRIVPYQALLVSDEYTKRRIFVEIHRMVGTLGCIQIASVDANYQPIEVKSEYVDKRFDRKHEILEAKPFLDLLNAAGAKHMESKRTRIGTVRIVP